VPVRTRLDERLEFVSKRLAGVDARSLDDALVAVSGLAVVREVLGVGIAVDQH